MRFLSLFAGIGGFDLGLERSNHECVGQIEIDGFCQRVLGQRFPYVARWSDVREWKSNGNEYLDLLCGGFPCQGASIAKETKPTWGLFENVPGIFSVREERDFHAILYALRQCWRVVGWRTLDSQHVGGCTLHGRTGVPQRRRRIFFVCGPTEDGVRQILFEPESRGWHSPAGGEKGEDIAICLATGSNGSHYDGVSEEFVVVNRVAATLKQRGRGATDDVMDNLQIVFQHKASATQSMNPSTLAPIMGVTKELAVLQKAGVRRLTPLEAERLQGFPDGWSCLCQPLEAYRNNPDEAQLRCTCADSPRYRALGNAVTVSVAAWLGTQFWRR